MADTDQTASPSPLGLLSSISLVGLGTPVLLIVMLGMMVLPLPPTALDLLFTFNISLSLMVLLAAVYTLRPLDFTVFPTLVLIATLLRLALNVASTRVVLLEGHKGTDAAGKVIQAFGDFVVGGNYTVGLVVFAILVIINFVVVTKGAGRISEVTARFTLDAMPGKQMAIDADLNAGLISQEAAGERRAEIAREADFYGAMDGASKFVRGDAVAGILILFINIVGGFAVGVLQHDLSINQAAENYILLTIGDGLVAQIPALLLSTAAALIVTRISDSQDIGQQVLSQLFANPRVMVITGSIMGALGLVPGMPNMVFLLLAFSLFGVAWYQSANRKNSAIAAAESKEPDVPAESMELSWDDVQPVDLVGLEVGYRLIAMVDRNQKGELLGRIKGVRKKLSQDLGFLLQPVHIRDNLDLDPNGYRITLLDVPVGEDHVYPGKDLAINPGQVYGELKGQPVKDPTFGLDAVWIDEVQRDEAQRLGYTVVDCATVIATHLSQLLKSHAHELLGHDEIQKLMDLLAMSSPKLVENLVPKALSLGVVLKVMQNLLREDIPIRDIRSIAETLAEHAAQTQEPDLLTGHVRTALARTITQNIIGSQPDMDCITLDPGLEQVLLESIQGGQSGGMEPGLAEMMLSQINQLVQKLESEGKPIVIMVASGLRLWLSKLLKPSYPDLHVLSYDEVPGNKRIKVIGSVGSQDKPAISAGNANLDEGSHSQ